MMWKPRSSQPSSFGLRLEKMMRRKKRMEAALQAEEMTMEVVIAVATMAALVASTLATKGLRFEL
jgi:hypothetical protein